MYEFDETMYEFEFDILSTILCNVYMRLSQIAQQCCCLFVWNIVRTKSWWLKNVHFKTELYVTVPATIQKSTWCFHERSCFEIAFWITCTFLKMQMGMLFIVVVFEIKMNCYEWNSENCMCVFVWYCL